MIGEDGVAMLRGMAGSAGGYRARTLDEGDIKGTAAVLAHDPRSVRRPASHLLRRAVTNGLFTLLAIGGGNLNHDWGRRGRNRG